MSGNFRRPKTLISVAVLRYKVSSFQEILAFTKIFPVKAAIIADMQPGEGVATLNAPACGSGSQLAGD
jgi:hypothetical protein